VIDGVPIQPERIIKKVRIFIVCTPLRIPIPSTEPMIAWDVETGTPMIANPCTTTAMEKTAMKAP
jgi:hypothetical protein